MLLREIPEVVLAEASKTTRSLVVVLDCFPHREMEGSRLLIRAC